MEKKTDKFKAIEAPNMHGFVAQRNDGISVEVVRCYEDDWTVFLTQGGTVVARSVEEYRSAGNGHLSYRSAMAIARKLL